MKERYRSMMGQVTLSEQARAAFKEKLDNVRPAKKGVRVLRTALIAACACVVLVGGAFAAEQVLRHISAEEPVSATRPDGNVVSFYKVTAPITKLPLDALSEEALEFAAGQMRLPAEKELPSWSEAEEFLGLELADSPILDEMGAVTVSFYGRTDGPSGIDLALSSSWVDGVRMEPRSDGFVVMESGTSVMIQVRLNTEAMLSTVAEAENTYVYQGSEVVTTQTWVTASDIEVLLADLPDDDGFVAHFMWNGAEYRIMATGTEGEEATVSMLKQIIESF